jgi:hypothetical protein
MVRIRRWVIGKRKKVVWSEPQLPAYVKYNPHAAPGPLGGYEPGDISMGAVAEEFLEMDEGEDEAPV